MLIIPMFWLLFNPHFYTIVVNALGPPAFAPPLRELDGSCSATSGDVPTSFPVTDVVAFVGKAVATNRAP